MTQSIQSPFPRKPRGGMGIRGGAATQLMDKVVDPETPSNVAVIVTVPAALAVDSPPPFRPLLIVAWFAEDVLQCAGLLKSWVVPSAKYPVAENCNVCPAFTVGFTGVTTMVCKA